VGVTRVADRTLVPQLSIGNAHLGHVNTKCSCKSMLMVLLLDQYLAYELGHGKFTKFVTLLHAAPVIPDRLPLVIG